MNPRGPAGDKSFTLVKGKKQMLLAQVMTKGRGKKTRQAFGAVFVLRAFTRMPARPYMRPALTEYRPKSTADFARGFRIGLRKGAA
jgi:hypothetical protein